MTADNSRIRATMTSMKNRQQTTTFNAFSALFNKSTHLKNSELQNYSDINYFFTHKQSTYKLSYLQTFTYDISIINNFLIPRTTLSFCLYNELLTHLPQTVTCPSYRRDHIYNIVAMQWTSVLVVFMFPPAIPTASCFRVGAAVILSVIPVF